MKAIPNPRRYRYLVMANVFLVTVALIVGMVGCYTNLPTVDAIEIRTWYDLYTIGNNMSADYVLENDLDATTEGWEELASPTANGGKGWEAIVGREEPQPAWFTGIFDGQGHEIRDLFINRPDEDRVALFAWSSLAGVIRNIGVVDASVTGGELVGGLVGQVSFGAVSNSYFTGTVTGDGRVGGLAGGMWNGGIVSNSYFMGSVSGDWDVGGLVGYSADGCTVSNCYSTGDVTGSEDVGHLVGDNGGTVSNSSWDIYTGGVWLDEGTGKTTAEMKDITTFTDTETEGLDESWDIAAVPYGEADPACIWNIVDGGTYPFLSWERPREIQEIWDWYDLYSIRSNLCGSYVLMDDLDSTTAGYEELTGPSANDGMGWEPIGTFDNGFNGILDGRGYEIKDLFVNRPENEEGIGLFGMVVGGMVRNTGLVDAAVTGSYGVGGLVGLTYGGTLSNSYSTGSVTGNMSVGGLVGRVGLVEDWGGTVYSSYATGTVTGDNHVGGLLGYNGYGTVTDSYSTGSVIGYHYYVGGLVGENSGTVSNSYSTGSVSGSEDVGGLVGSNEGTVSESYSTSSVSADNYVGGLVGYNTGTGTVSESYATGSVAGSSYAGGLVAYNSWGVVSNSFWDTETSGQDTSDGGTGKNTTEMQDIVTFTDTDTVGLDEPWDITAVVNPGTRNLAYIWNIVDDETYPFLSWQPVA